MAESNQKEPFHELARPMRRNGTASPTSITPYKQRAYENGTTEQTCEDRNTQSTNQNSPQSGIKDY